MFYSKIQKHQHCDGDKEFEFFVCLFVVVIVVVIV